MEAFNGGWSKIVQLAIFSCSLRSTRAERRYDKERSKTECIRPVLSAIGVVVLSIAGWLGGELVFKGGVGVEERTIAGAE